MQEGRSLAEVQRLLLASFNISMTYMDLRFLVDDLDIAVVESVSEEAEQNTGATPATVDAELLDDEAGNVRVEVDAVMRPGALVSGTVRFSDGQTLSWQLSATGQLGLIPDENRPEYRPLPEDLQEFQIQLNEVLQQKGF